MAVRLNSYISFNGDAAEAMEFYKSIFGGEVYSDTFGGFQEKAPDMTVDEADRDKVMHAYLKGDNGIELMSADVPTGMAYNEGSRLSLTLNGDDEELLRGYWDKLADGGTIDAPLFKAPWGDTFGMLSDKYGVKWMIDIGPVQNQ